MPLLRMTLLAIVLCSISPAADTWQSLFDGKTFTGWTLGDGAPVTHSWLIEEGSFTTVASTNGRSDLLYAKPVRNFELTFEFRLSKGANTGVKYFVLQTLRYLSPGSGLEGSYGAVGLEFQLVDDSIPEVAAREKQLGALYGLLPPEATVPYKIGEWGQARLLCRNKACEHWINGKRVLAYDLTSESVRNKLLEAAVSPKSSIVGATAAMVAARRQQGPAPKAFISLQQHNSKAWFRKLQLRELD